MSTFINESATTDRAGLDPDPRVFEEIGSTSRGWLSRLGAAPEVTLRRALVTNSQFSCLGGVAALVFGDQLAEMMDVNAWLVRIVGACLLVFALDVWFVSRRGVQQLVPLAKLISASDAAWVLGTIVVIVSGLVSGVGMVLLGVVGLAVADFAIVQWWSASKLGGSVQAA